MSTSQAHDRGVSRPPARTTNRASGIVVTTHSHRHPDATIEGAFGDEFPQPAARGTGKSSGGTAIDNHSTVESMASWCRSWGG
ncbi:hypothetical protein HSRCO_0106 [Halanaeroarchaeum sp. HSR-CO]|nr:hypothetical protein HSRCO_0106 [Halanaeroarchaeum sp. HSR-CO]